MHGRARLLYVACGLTFSTTSFRRIGSRRRRGNAERAGSWSSTDPREPFDHRRFAEFPELLREGDLLVRNDVRVRLARLFGRDGEGRLVEVFLLRPDRRRPSPLGGALANRGGGQEGKKHPLPGRSRSARGERAGGRPARDRLRQGARRKPSRANRQRPPATLHPARAGRSRPARGPRGLPDRLRPRAPGGRRADRGTPLHRRGSGEYPESRCRHRGPDALHRRGNVQARREQRHGISSLRSGGCRHSRATLAEIDNARRQRRRVIAVGTTVTRALEAAARLPGGLATGETSLSRRTSSSRRASSSARWTPC